MNSEHLELTLCHPHVHLTKRMVWKLFGEGAKLTADSPTDMPGKFTAKQRVTVTGPSGKSVELPITGPSSPYNQVELTHALAELLGADAKVELSGTGTGGGVTLSGNFGEAELEAGVIIPQPHIHMPPEDASTLSLLEGQIISLETDDGRRLDNVAVRISHLYANRIHLLEEENCPFSESDTFHIV